MGLCTSKEEVKNAKKKEGDQSNQTGDKKIEIEKLINQKEEEIKNFKKKIKANESKSKKLQ